MKAQTGAKDIVARKILPIKLFQPEIKSPKVERFMFVAPTKNLDAISRIDSFISNELLFDRLFIELPLQRAPMHV